MRNDSQAVSHAQGHVAHLLTDISLKDIVMLRKTAIILAFALAVWAFCGAIVSVGRQSLGMDSTLSAPRYRRTRRGRLLLPDLL